MKIAICSDMHLEFADFFIQNTENADVLVLSGDIFVAVDLPSKRSELIPPNLSDLRGERYYKFIQNCSKEFPNVIYIMGNHEHYHGDFAKTVNIIRDSFTDLNNVHVLDKEFINLNGVNFFGGTLWTDMNGEDHTTMSSIKFMMNDYQSVKNTTKREGFYTKKFLPEDSVEDHKEFLRKLNDMLVAFPNTPAVVCGHHAPSKASTHPKYKHETLMNGAYSTELSNLMLDNRQIKLWTHGHTHEVFDYMIGTTRVVCNPRGYEGYEDRADHFELKYVDI